jgi:uncharacterized membrane protein
MLGILGVLFAVLIALTTVSALSVDGPYYANLCQCDSIKEKYTVCADVAGTYNISATGEAAKWLSIAPSALALDANTCGDFYAFVTPECYANSGDYSANVLISGPEDYNKSLEIVVNQCHSFDYTVSPQYNSSKPCQENVFNISVKNTGKFIDEFVLLQTGLPDNWGSYPQTKFVLNPYEQLNTQLKVKSNCNAQAGDYNFKLNLANTRTNANGSKSLIQNIQKFVPISFGGLFVNSNYYRAKSCEEFDKNVVFTAVNYADKDDVLTLYLLDSNRNPLSKDIAYFEKSIIALDVNKPVDVSMIIKKHSPAVTSGVIVVNSKNYDTNFEASIDYVFENCYDLNITSVESSTSACLGKKTQVFKVSNYGTQDADVNVSITLDNNTIETKAISLNANSSENVSFTITPLSAGTINETVLAKSAFAENKLSFPFVFENCYDASMQANNILVCKEGVVNQTFSFTNSGTATQNFKLSIDSNWLYFTQSEVLISGKETKTVSLVGSVPKEYALSQTITAQSIAGTLSKTVSVVTIPELECHDMNFAIQNTIDANCCDGTIVPLIVTNTGYFAQEIAVRAVVPPWVTLSEDSLSLLPKENKLLYVYVSPPAGTEGDYNATITISNDANITKEIKFVVRARGASCSLVVGADVNVNNTVSDTKVFTRKEVTVEFVVSNDSNVGFNVTNIAIKDMNATVDFNKGVFLLPGETTVVKLTTMFGEGIEPSDKNVSLTIETSAGTFEKSQLISFSGKENEPLGITGWFSAYTAPIVGLLLLVLLILVVLALVSSKKASAKKPKFKK